MCNVAGSSEYKEILLRAAFEGELQRGGPGAVFVEADKCAYMKLEQIQPDAFRESLQEQMEADTDNYGHFWFFSVNQQSIDVFKIPREDAAPFFAEWGVS